MQLFTDQLAESTSSCTPPKISSSSFQTPSPFNGIQITMAQSQATRTPLLRGPGGLLYPPWDPAHGPMPQDYPQPKRSRASTPVPRMNQVSHSPTRAPASESQAVSRAMVNAFRGVGAEVKKAAAEARAEGGSRRKVPAKAPRRKPWVSARIPKASALLYFGGAALLLALAQEPSFLR